MQKILSAAGVAIVISLALVLQAYHAVSIGGLQASMDSLVRSLNSEPTQVENYIMQPPCVMRSKVIEEVTHTLTWYWDRVEFPDYDDFLRMVNTQWQAYCDSL